MKLITNGGVLEDSAIFYLEIKLRKALRQRTNQIVIFIQLSSKPKHRVAIVTCQGCVNLGDHLRGGEWIINTRAGRVEQGSYSGAEQASCGTCLSGATLVIQCIQECVVYSVTIQVKDAIGEEGTDIEYISHQICWIIRCRP